MRVHTNAAAARSAEAVQARAYTVGDHIVFGAHETPTAGGNRQLLAHELAHVVQQSRGRGVLSADNPNEALEVDADHAASAISHGGGSIRIAGSGPIQMARSPAPPPQVAKLLTAADLVKLRAFGNSDYEASIGALQDILNKTKGFTEAGAPQQYVDIRQSAGELRAFLDYIRNPAIAGVKVVPSQMGNRSPDLYLREVGGREFRGEVVNVTQASRDVRPDLGIDKRGRSVPRIPKGEPEIAGGKPPVELPTNTFKLGQIKTAISGKITPKAAGQPTQLDALNPATQAGGRPMAAGGDVVVEVLDGAASKAELDKIIGELLPKLQPSSVKRVLISIIDSANPSAGRTVFEYVRGDGDVFVGTARAGFYRPGAVGGGAAGSSNGAPQASVSTQAKSATTPSVSEGEPAKPSEALKPGESLQPSELAKPGEGPAAPTVAGEAAAAGEPKLRIGSGPKGRLAISLGAMAAITALEMLNRAQMAKEESERGLKWIEQTTGNAATSTRVADLVHQQRLSIARRQLNGQKVFASISMKLAFTNDVIDSAGIRDITISDADESSFTNSIMTHEPLTNTEGRVWYVHVSLILDQVELSDVEKAQLLLEKHDTDTSSTQTLDPDQLSALGAQRQRLQASLDEAKTKEAKARREALGRSTVIGDAAKRAQQQAEIADELRDQAAKQPPAAQTPQPQTPRSSSPSLLPPVQQESPPLLPGAPSNNDPIKMAARTVSAARGWADRLVSAGTALRDRLNTDRPSKQEIDAFLNEEHVWRLETKWWMNYYHNESRPEAVTGLGELLDRQVPKLQELRVQLGGD